LLRQILESIVGKMTDTQFAEVLDLATSDIKTNRVDFGKRTSLSDAVEIARSCFKLLRRGKVA